MREYAALATGCISELLAAMAMWVATDMEVLGIALFASCIFVIMTSLFMALTEGR